MKLLGRGGDRDTVNARIQVGQLVRELAAASDAAFEIAADLAGNLGRARSLTRNFKLTAAGSRNVIWGARDSAVELGRIHACARGLAHAVTEEAAELDRTRVMARQLVIDLGLASQRACAYVDNRRELLVSLHSARKSAENLVHALDEQASAVQSAVVAVRVSTPAQWLMDLALHALPVMERSRYAEEWRSELWDLAEGPGRRRRQVVHALRTAACAVPQRSGIREGRRRAAAGGG